MNKYCDAIFAAKRWKTRVVMVGDIGVGGDNPVRIQSMTTSSTRDVDATVRQIIRLKEAGCEIVRITVQGMKEAEACEGIQVSLIQQGIKIPLVADIHFYPPAAMKVIDFVDKVRINPGNFVDKRASFKVIEYDDAAYQDELDKIEEKFTPLVEKCKKLKKAMRIGTNHGSLSDRIMNRYGDTPRGMVESALEFARVCRKNDFHNFIFSMKSSNPQVMILAYRLLAREMMSLGWDYPLHLGVTEAGDGEDGRVKSAMGIGALLLDGLGDTIRVSLTEDPWFEIDPCQRLVKFAKAKEGCGIAPFTESFRKIEEPVKRKLEFSKKAAFHREGTVALSIPPELLQEPQGLKQLGVDLKLGSLKPTISSIDDFVLSSPSADAKVLERMQSLKKAGIFSLRRESIKQAREKALKTRFGKVEEEGALALLIEENDPAQWAAIKELQPVVILLAPLESRLHVARRFFEWILKEGIEIPVLLNFSYDCSPEDLIIQSSAECGALLCDGLGDGLFLEGPYSTDVLRQLSFNILQAARRRTVKTDFISCPSCGRTLFDLQDVTRRIRSRTAHLPGVKIAIMGCIVNGPGEMADADFGYVGSKPGMIDLYVGKTCVQKDIAFADADDKLVDLIKTHGRWQEPELVT